MPFALALLAPLLAQAGPMVTPGAAPPLPHQTQAEPLRSPRRPAQPAQAASTDAGPCPPTDDAEAAVREWQAKAKGPEAAKAGECLGVALARLDRWDEAADAFRAARAAADTPARRARLGAMAGEAALNAGDPQAALAALDAAASEAGQDAPMAGAIALYRARALVALDRENEAEAPLAQARAAMPDDATAWLLSATLSRRLNKLAQAQAEIEKAAELRPTDPAIGLEAGVIAVLTGRDEAARKSWRSVVAAAPDSEAAATARGYLAQLDPQSAPAPSR